MEEEVVRALDLADGREIWRHATPVAYRRHPAALKHGKGPRSTPAVAGGSVCALGVTGRLSCLDQESGKLRWAHEFAERFDRAWPEFGTAMSPAIIGDRVIAHVGGIESGSLSAFDLENGREIWSWNADGPGYTSPVEVTIDGVDQIVTQSRSYVVSVAAAPGALLWKMPFETPYQQNSVTPLVVGSRVIISGLDQGTTALEPRRDGQGNWLLEIAWRNDEFPMYMSSPVLHGGLLFGMTDKKKGQLFCLDVETGEIRWTSEGREGDNASLIATGDRLIVLTTEAELQIGAANGEGWSPWRQTVADSETWAHPALAGDRILIKDHAHLTAWSFD
jgi:outer membrane protein assembly factor BamB